LGVLAGTVKISVPSADGREIVLNIMREGDIFGAISALDSRPRGADATAMTDCELIVIERRDFIPFLHGQPDLCMHVIDLLCSRVRRRTEQIQDVTFLDLPTRLAKALLRLAADAQPPGSAPKVVITQSEISQIIGRSREMTNKQLRAWASDGLIRLEQRLFHRFTSNPFAARRRQGRKSTSSRVPNRPAGRRIMMRMSMSA